MIVGVVIAVNRVFVNTSGRFISRIKLSRNEAKIEIEFVAGEIVPDQLDGSIDLERA